MAHRHLEDRIVPQRVAIIGVLIARRDREHPQPKHLLERVLNAFRLAPVADARSKARRQPELLLDTAQHKHAGVRRQLATIEPNAQLLARNRWKFKRQQAIFAHNGCGAPQSIRESECNQNHESNDGFPLHPSLNSPIGVNSKGYRPINNVIRERKSKRDPEQGSTKAYSTAEVQAAFA